jgi:arsenate reductase
MTGHICTVLFLCTGNSARSILAEAVLARLGDGRFRALSAGSQPKGTIHPLALDALAAHGFATTGLRSKSWDEFATDDAPRVDIIITLCDSAAGESCPVWLGRPITCHWGLPDPAAASGSSKERRAAFENTLQAVSARIRRFVELPLDDLDDEALRERMSEIGRLAAEGSTEVA